MDILETETIGNEKRGHLMYHRLFRDNEINIIAFVKEAVLILNFE